MLYIVRIIVITVFKSSLIREMQENGFVVDHTVSVWELHRFFFKAYE